MMNVHYLELFYYVARYEGISEAVRRMPYGIQQPAVSSQIIQLEQFLGTALFQRRPFSLTPEGEELYRFIEPFFGGLADMTRKLQSGTAKHVRIAASEIVLHDHVPHVVSEVRKEFPGLRLTLREGYQPSIERWIEAGEVDFALTLIRRTRIPGLTVLPMFDLPLTLIVPRKSSLKSAEELWRRDRINEPLITLPDYEAMCRVFQDGLRRRGLDWFPGIEVSSLNLIQTYVENGYGIGLFLDVPGMRIRPGLRCIPLGDFGCVTFGVLWRGARTPLVDALVRATRDRALAVGAAVRPM